MSKGQRSTSTQVAIGKLLVIAHIRSADSGGLDLDLKLACRGLLEASGFLDSGKKTGPLPCAYAGNVPVSDREPREEHWQ